MEPVRATGGEKSASASRVGTGHIAGRETESDCSTAESRTERSDFEPERRAAPPGAPEPASAADRTTRAHTSPLDFPTVSRSLFYQPYPFGIREYRRDAPLQRAHRRSPHRRGGRRPRGFASGSGVGAARGAVHDSVYTRTPRPAVSRGPGRPNARPRPRHGTRRSSSLSDLTSSEDSSAHRSALCAHRYRSRLTAHGSACGASESR